MSSQRGRDETLMIGMLRLDKHLLHREASSAPPLYLIVGLGNPGEEYARNRHNIGFQCIDHLAGARGIPFQLKRFNALLGEGQIGPRRVLMAKPLTFMNDSGKAVGNILRGYRIPLERVLVIHDDLDLPLGRIRLRASSGSGGHKGVTSIIAELGTRCFARLRVGIGRPTVGDSVQYVLSDFSADQQPVVKDIYPLVERAALCFLEEGIHEAMNAYNAPGT